MTQPFKDRKGNLHEKPDGRQVAKRIAAYGIARASNRVLLVRPAWKDVLELPGGGAENEETAIDCLKREFLEETGFSIRLIGNSPVKVKEELFYADDIDEYYDSKLLFFLVSIVGSRNEEAIKRQEIREISWHSINALDSKAVNKNHMAVLKEVLNKREED